MMIYSEPIKGYSESYIVKFWYSDIDGYLKQGSKEFWCNSKAAHKVIEDTALKVIRKEGFSNPEIISVIYQ